MVGVCGESAAWTRGWTGGYPMAGPAMVTRKRRRLGVRLCILSVEVVAVRWWCDQVVTMGWRMRIGGEKKKEDKQ